MPRHLERLTPYLLIAPSLIFLGVFFIVPLIEALIVSFTGPGGSLGLQNYTKAAADLNFTPALKNTLILVAVVVPLQVIFALGMAMMLQKVNKGRDLVLWIWTIPLGISDLAAGIVWLAIFTDRGYLNSMLMWMGFISGPGSYLTYETPLMLFAAVILAEIWRATAIVFIILVSGIQLVPKEYGEAAEVFGASAWTRFVKITLPLLKPSLQTALILRTILAFEVFAVVVALGGTNIRVLAGEAYSWQNDNQNYGVASAYAVVILVLSLASTIVFLKLMGERKETQT
ncbi:MAG: carbohydrate ABC transporter permease [Beijerinckiaceae bacterium]